MGHALGQEEVAAIQAYPRSAWASEGVHRLVALASNLLVLKESDPLLGEVISEINGRPKTELEKLTPGILYPLHVLRILSENEIGLTAGRLRGDISSIVQDLVNQKCGAIQRVSQFEAAFQGALTQMGAKVQRSAKAKYGLSIDYLCKYKSWKFCVEVNGPSHYLVEPKHRPRGKTTLKMRTFAAMKVKFVSIPYWVVSPPEKYVPAALSGRVPTYSINPSTLQRELLNALGRSGN